MHRNTMISIAGGAAGLALAGTALLATTGCGDQQAAAPSGVEPRRVADMLHAVMAADRKVYVAKVVNRLTKEQEIEIKDPVSGEIVKMVGSEDWEKEPGTLPLPAQMFRMGSEEAMRLTDEFTYGLISSWPINRQNEPKEGFEKENIATMETTGEPVYGEETIAGQTYFVAMYPDRATATACWDCHNKHPDSPRDDFEPEEVMGGVVIRIPL